MTVAGDTPSLGRLRWRCRRGMKELDSLLSGWLDGDWPLASAEQRAAFERLLEAEDNDLWRWFTGREAPPNPQERALVEAIRTARKA
jgi:antitoxin CptB